MNEIKRYGVHSQTLADNEIARAIEEIKRNGYSIVKSGYDADKQAEIIEYFNKAYDAQAEKHGLDFLKSIDEDKTIRAPYCYYDIFYELMQNPSVTAICKELIGGAYILNQQNGIINPPNGERYNQGEYHRDLPYQHFVSSRPLALNALYCIDDFTLENGATYVLPASHKEESFPSDSFIRANQVQAIAQAGDFIVMDCMVYHSGGVNKSAKQRRAVNNVFTIPLIKQQIDIPSMFESVNIQDDNLKKLLGINYVTPSSVQEYYSNRQKR
jgi:ectoine hydroxylase-related dioxygenase (phytanoyl-CoA dioxygenase family)